MSRKTVIVVFTILMTGWSVAQAFPFCFSFGGGGGHQTNFNNRPPPAVGFGPDVYNYPRSPVPGASLYRPYYPVPFAPEFYMDRIQRPGAYR